MNSTWLIHDWSLTMRLGVVWIHLTMIVKYLWKKWDFSQVSVRVDFHQTITILLLEFAFLQSVTTDVAALVLIVSNGWLSMKKSIF